jgi:dienelactone hydrolase
MRKLCVAGAALLILSASALAQEPNTNTDQDQARRVAAARAAANAMPDTPGTGPYPAAIMTDPTLPNHVIYRPANLAGLGKKKLGILLWGNGGCTDDGSSARLHLEEIASHGYLAIAPGLILSGPSRAADAKAPDFMKTYGPDVMQGLDWALAENKRKGSPYYGRIDPNAVAISGHSCGGILSIQMAPDPRIKAVIIHNSGVFPNRPERPTLITDKAWLKGLHTPILYIIGNPTDVGYPVAQDDYTKIDHVPVFLASLKSVGHGGTFAQPNGGAAARVAVDWLEWQLRGDKRAARIFTGADCGLCRNPDWVVQRKRID